jgi:SpoVK/Ycf46/Vps4 family AAA+-type ATPase
MASGAQIKALLMSHADGDDAQFYAVALQVAAAEARKGHADVAKELRDLVENSRKREARHEAKENVLHIAQPDSELSDLLTMTEPKTRLSELVLDEAVLARIRRILSEQHHLDRLKSHALRPRQSLLLTGPPGCGKTLTASAIAGELALPLFVVRLESLITRFLGETANKLRRIFDGVERFRGVYFFDEFDSIGMARGSEHDVGEMRRVLNSFLVLVETQRGNSLVIAATNHGHKLDRALFRRFDDIIEMGLPDKQLAERAFRERLAGQKKNKFNYAKLAEASDGLSFAEITRVCEEGIKEMLIHDRQSISTEDLMRMISERRVFLDQRSH